MNDPLSASLDELALRWGRWMFGVSWQLLIVVLAVWGISWLFRKRSPTLVHAIWLVVLLRLIVPPSLASPTGWGWWVRGNEQRAFAPSVEAAAFGQSLPGDRPNGPQLQAQANAAPRLQNGGFPLAPPNAEGVADPPPLAVERPTPVIEQPKPARHVDAPITPWIPARWVTYAMLAWGGVSLAMLGLLAAGTFRVRQWVLSAEPIDDGGLYLLLADCQKRVGFSRPVELRNSDSCTTPVVVGQYRPTILLPRAVLEGLSRDELRGVLLHELHHLRRGDAIINLLQGLLTAIYWFHPLVWWANARIREWRELACDEATLETLPGGQRAYGGVLVKVTEIFGYASPPLALGVMESKGATKTRLGRILAHRTGTKLPAAWKSGLLMLGLSLVLLPGGAPAGGVGLFASTEQRLFSNPSDVDQPVVDIAAGEGLRRWEYHFQKDQVFPYSTTIEAEWPDGTETLTGTPVWRVQSLDALGARLSFVGGLTSTKRSRDFEPLNVRGMFPGESNWFGNEPFDAPPVLDLSQSGGVQHQSGEVALPWLLGELPKLVFCQLPDQPIGLWSAPVDETVPYAMPSSDDADRSPFRMGPRFRPFRSKHQVRKVPVQGRRVFSVLKRSDAEIQLAADIELFSREVSANGPAEELTGRLIYDFSLTEGEINAVSGRLKYVSRRLGEEIAALPLRISCRLMDATEWQRLQAAATPVQPGSFPPPADGDSAVSGKESEKRLRDLQSRDASRVSEAVSQLEKLRPDESRDDVREVLCELARDEQTVVRLRAARGLAVWGKANDLDTLCTLVSDTSDSVAVAATKAIQQIGGERAAEALIDLASNGIQRIAVMAALREFGEEAEPGIRRLLDSDDWTLRNDACLILANIGTQDSLERLQAVARSDENDAVRNHAREAVRSIRSR